MAGVPDAVNAKEPSTTLEESTASQLEERDLVERTPSPEDRRGAFARLTQVVLDEAAPAAMGSGAV